MGNPYFQFKQFTLHQNEQVFKLSTDSVLLGAWVQAIDRPMRILDIGTGTGILALMMAQRFAQAEIEAVEMDDASVRCAAQNFERSPWNNRLHLHHLPLQTFAKHFSASPYDLIVCNPPYFQNQYLPKSHQKQQFKHTVSLSYEVLFYVVNTLLAHNGTFALVIPSEMYSVVVFNAQMQNLHLWRKLSIRVRPHQQAKRVVLQFSKSSDIKLEEADLVIYDQRQGTQYSADYIALTRDFYL